MSTRKPQRTGPVLAAQLLLAIAMGCSERRPETAPPPVFAGDVAELLQTRCAGCHEDDDAGGGFRVDSYLDVVGCPLDMPMVSAVERGDAGVPLLDALGRADHAGVLHGSERARLLAWLHAGAPLRVGGVHAPGILNPRSTDWHGRLAAENSFGPITSAQHPRVCGRCHDGAPVKPKGVVHPAPGAPACTSCHREPAGVLACGTCHGDGAARAYPPRDPCLFPGGKGGAHRAHVESTRLSATKLDCSTCHPAVRDTPSATHANGRVDVLLDPVLAGPDASYDRATGRCAVRCHNRGGARAQPSFFDAPSPLGCGDCHGAPPADHYTGECDRCHAEPNADGTALRATVLHMNGVVDVGRGGSGCSACHGKDGDPMPDTPSHRLHRDTQLTSPIACTECHILPTEVGSPGHLARASAPATLVTFGDRARERGRNPSYEAGTCKDIACHGAGLPEGIERALVWDAPASHACAGCHGVPPEVAHPKDDGCASLVCHGTEVSADTTGRRITAVGRARHIDGHIDTVQP
ncbi:MAG: CxxxxCH/CxxCH domain-containing protein [Polyangiales bacterium]